MFGASPLSPSPETKNDGNPIDEEEASPLDPIRLSPASPTNSGYERNLPP